MDKLPRSWYGVLNAENIELVAERIREVLSGDFAIAEALYTDSTNADLRLISSACRLDSEWTTAPTKEPVRVFRETSRLKPQLEIVCEAGSSPWMGFSAGGYLWGFHARPDGGHEHEDYRYPYFSFEADKFTVTDRAPAGKGCLHKRVFGAIEHYPLIDNLKETLDDIEREFTAKTVNVTGRALQDALLRLSAAQTITTKLRGSLKGNHGN